MVESLETSQGEASNLPSSTTTTTTTKSSSSSSSTTPHTVGLKVLVQSSSSSSRPEKNKSFSNDVQVQVTNKLPYSDVYNNVTQEQQEQVVVTTSTNVKIGNLSMKQSEQLSNPINKEFASEYNDASLEFQKDQTTASKVQIQMQPQAEPTVKANHHQHQRNYSTDSSCNSGDKHSKEAPPSLLQKNMSSTTTDQQEGLQPTNTTANTNTNTTTEVSPSSPPRQQTTRMGHHPPASTSSAKIISSIAHGQGKQSEVVEDGIMNLVVEGDETLSRSTQNNYPQHQQPTPISPTGFLTQVRRQSHVSDFDDDDTDFSVETVNTNDTNKKDNLKDDNNKATTTTNNNYNSNTTTSSTETTILPIKMTVEDIEICQQLDDEYERALEEREVGYTARYNSVRQSAFFSVLFMVSYLLLGTAFFMRQADWTVADSLLFSIYTVTTVGYGNQRIPRTPGFQLYTIFYILIGIAALTIMVAQVYQCIALEASRAQYSRDKSEMAQRGMEILTNSTRNAANNNTNSPTTTTAAATVATRGNVHGQALPDEIISYHLDNMPGLLDHAFRGYDRAKKFFRTNEIGRGISVLFPFAGLILLGALIVGPIEEWSALEAVYFSIVSLTTVGFGDYFPTQPASIWFCIFWLPFSVGFMSLFLGNVAAFYIRLSDKNIARIERHMRRRLERSKKLAQLERAEALKRAYRGQDVDLSSSSAIFPGQKINHNTTPQEGAASAATAAGTASIPIASPDNPDQTDIPQNNILRPGRKRKGFDMVPTNDSGSGDDTSVVSARSAASGGLFGHARPSDSGRMRRERILNNSMNNLQSTDNGGKNGPRSQGRTMQAMRDVVRAVRSNLIASQEAGYDLSALDHTEVEFMSIRSNKPMVSHSVLRREAVRKPSFALRVLVQERMAEIIATDIAGYQSNIDIKETTLSVTIDTLKDTADKWLIPRRARKAFRAVAFETLYFVGEHGLITRGADALYDLTPFEFHGLFNPLLASMGDAETMEGWLASTDILADVDLRRDGSRPGLSFIKPAAAGGVGGRPPAKMQESLHSHRSLTSTEIPTARFKRLTPGNAFSK